MEEGREHITGNEFRGARIRIFGTNSDNPYEGRVFIWTKMGWFERIEGQSGGAAFIPVAKSQGELRELISRDDPSSDLIPLSGEYRKMVSEEFIEQSPSHSDSENSSEKSSEDDFEEDQQQYHQHN